MYRTCTNQTIVIRIMYFVLLVMSNKYINVAFSHCLRRHFRTKPSGIKSNKVELNNRMSTVWMLGGKSCNLSLFLRGNVRRSFRYCACPCRGCLFWFRVQLRQPDLTIRCVLIGFLPNHSHKNSRSDWIPFSFVPP